MLEILGFFVVDSEVVGVSLYNFECDECCGFLLFMCVRFGCCYLVDDWLEVFSHLLDCPFGKLFFSGVDFFDISFVACEEAFPVRVYSCC